MTKIALIALGIVLLGTTACGGGGQSGVDDDLISRGEVAAAFEQADEPVVVSLDLTASDPGSSVDVIFVPADEDVAEPPFELTLFESEASAMEHAKRMEEVAGSGSEVVQWKNAVLNVSADVPKDHRILLIATIRSL